MLHYDYLSPDLIQSPHLQHLVQMWDSLRGDHSLPEHSPSMRHHLGKFFDSMSFFAVENEHLRTRFLIVDHGPVIEELYGAACTGKYLDESMPAARYEMAGEAFFKAMEKKTPIYTVAKSNDANGIAVIKERLYLPFGSPSLGVTHLWLAIEPSASQAFTRARLLASPQLPVFVMKAAIETSLLHS